MDLFAKYITHFISPEGIWSGLQHKNKKELSNNTTFKNHIETIILIIKLPAILHKKPKYPIVKRDLDLEGNLNNNVFRPHWKASKALCHGASFITLQYNRRKHRFLIQLPKMSLPSKHQAAQQSQEHSCQKIRILLLHFVAGSHLFT